MLMSDASTDQLSVTSVDQDLVERLYARFASVYNGMFGPILHAGRVEAMRELPLKPNDEILEVGIGTGLTATLYPSDCRVVGIDLSAAMLREAGHGLTALATPEDVARTILFLASDESRPMTGANLEILSNA